MLIFAMLYHAPGLRWRGLERFEVFSRSVHRTDLKDEGTAMHLYT